MTTMLARFRPSRVDDLRPEAAAIIDVPIEWQSMWTVTDEDGGPYVGQTVWVPTDQSLRVGWAPDEDLVPDDGNPA